MISRDDIEHPLCSECQQRHPLSFRFNGRLRGWHEQLAERRSETGRRNVAKRGARS